MTDGAPRKDRLVVQRTQTPGLRTAETVRVSVTVKDDRGFTHYYEDVVTTPEAVRDAFDLMARRAPTTGASSTAG